MKAGYFVRIIFLLSVFFQSFAQEKLLPENYFDGLESGGFFCKRPENQFAQKQSVSLQRTLIAAGQDYNFTGLKAWWKVTPDTAYISGKVTAYFVPNVDSFSIITFELSNYLKVYQVQYHNKLLHFSHKDNILFIELPNYVLREYADSVSIWYGGHPEPTGFGSFLSAPHSQGRCTWTLSEPYGSRDWWPSKLTLNDKIDSTDIYLYHPVGTKAAAIGVRQSIIQLDDTMLVTHWKHRYPVDMYLIAIAVSNYSEVNMHFFDEGTQDSLRIQNFAFPQDSIYSVTTMGDQHDAFRLFTKILGPYPFSREQYGNLQFGWRGGMEHQTLSYITGWMFELMAHEMAHQWFGDKITASSWQDVWLHEGFAHYLTTYCFEKLFDGRYFYQRKWGVLREAAKDATGSVFVDSDTLNNLRVFLGALSYHKASIVLHQLRWLIGDEAFFTAIRTYIQDPNLIYSYAKTQHLQKHFEIACNCSLTEYFQDFFYGKGYPSYLVEYKQDADNFLNVRLIQTTTHPSVSFFEIAVPLRIYGKNSSGNNIDTTLRLDLSENFQLFHVPLSFALDSLRLDSDLWLLRDTTVRYLPINFVSDEDRFWMYPNPTEKTVNFQLFFEEAENAHIEIINGLSQLIQKWDFNSPTLKIELPIDITPGVYFVKLNIGKKRRFTRKLLVY